MVKRAPEDGGLPILSTYLSGTACACGTAATSVPVPAGATSALIHAAGAALYWNVNAAATVNSPGYAAADGHGFVPPIDNFASLSLIGAGTTAIGYVSFYQD